MTVKAFHKVFGGQESRLLLFYSDCFLFHLTLFLQQHYQGAVCKLLALTAGKFMELNRTLGIAFMTGYVSTAPDRVEVDVNRLC